MRNEKTVAEAVRRMKMLGLFNESSESIIELFKENGTLYKSIPAIFNTTGVLYTLTDAEKKIVSEFEEETGCLAYHVIRNSTEIGVMYSILYVSNEEDEWGMDREDITGIEDGTVYPIAYVYNAGNVSSDEEDLSGGFGEFGSIGVEAAMGGLCRVA